MSKIANFFRKATAGEALARAFDIQSWNRIINVLQTMEVEGGDIDRPKDGKPWKINMGKPKNAGVPVTDSDNEDAPAKNRTKSIEAHGYDKNDDEKKELRLYNWGTERASADITPTTSKNFFILARAKLGKELLYLRDRISRVTDSEQSGGEYQSIDVTKPVDEEDPSIIGLHNFRVTEPDGVMKPDNQKSYFVLARHKAGKVLQYLRLSVGHLADSSVLSAQSKSIESHAQKEDGDPPYLSLYNWGTKAEDKVLAAADQKDYLVLAKTRTGKTLKYLRLNLARQADSERESPQPSFSIERNAGGVDKPDYYSIYGFQSGSPASSVTHDTSSDYRLLSRTVPTGSTVPKISYLTIPGAWWLGYYNATIQYFDKDKINHASGNGAYWARLQLWNKQTGKPEDNWIPIFHVLSMEKYSGSTKQGETASYQLRCWLMNEFFVQGFSVYNGKDGALYGQSGKDNVLTMYVGTVTAGTGDTTLDFQGGGQGVNTQWTLVGNIKVDGLKELQAEVASIQVNVTRIIKDIGALNESYDDLLSRIIVLENGFEEVRALAKQAAEALAKLPEIEGKIFALETALSQTNASLDSAIQTLSAGIVQNAQAVEALEARVKALEGK